MVTMSASCAAIVSASGRRVEPRPIADRHARKCRRLRATRASFMVRDLQVRFTSIWCGPSGPPVSAGPKACPAEIRKPQRFGNGPSVRGAIEL